MSLQEAALAFIVSQHNSDMASQERLAVLEAENAKLRAERAAKKVAASGKIKASAAPIHSAVIPTVMLREPTLESSTEFMRAVRASRSREETIKALDAFVGYNLGGDFGSQDVKARMMAQRLLSGQKATGPSQQEQARASRSLAGFVAGLPDQQGKILANLRAQAEKATEALIECEKAGNTVGATVERERLNGAAGIYAQIRAMGFDR